MAKQLMRFHLICFAFFFMYSFFSDKREVNGFANQCANRNAYMASDSDSDSRSLHSDTSSGDFSLPMLELKQRLVPPRKGKGKGKGKAKGCGGETITISTDDVPKNMPIRCAFCHEWGHHLTLCVKAFKDRLEKVHTHCAHGFHKPWFHDGVECRCRYCGIHLRHLDRYA